MQCTQERDEDNRSAEGVDQQVRLEQCAAAVNNERHRRHHCGRQCQQPPDVDITTGAVKDLGGFAYTREGGGGGNRGGCNNRSGVRLPLHPHQQQQPLLIILVVAKAVATCQEGHYSHHGVEGGG
jgi:hypothetical protein